jgi:thioredoxin-like negative regulator of GroEL
MFERLAILFIGAIVGYAVYRLYRAWQLQQATQQISKQTDDPVLRDLQKGTPAIVYFTTPFCVPCKTIQQPALEQLRLELGAKLQIVQIDATQAPHIADSWGVMSAPTTFILDEAHRAHTVNHGAVDAQQLKQQLRLSA